MAAGTTAKADAKTIEAILQLEKQEEARLAVHYRIFHRIGSFVGTAKFILLQCLMVIIWILFNTAMPARAIDPFPFPFLGTVLCLEAVLLTSCVLIRQSTTDKALEKRDHLELQINLLAERESTRSLRILQKIAQSMQLDDEDYEQDELVQETSVDEIARELRKNDGQPSQ